MKRYIALALALILALSLCACGVGQENDIEKVSGIEGMRKRLYFWIDAPEGAEDVRYAVISGMIGQVQYTLDGTEYCFRASVKREDHSGVSGPFEEEITQFLVEHPIENSEATIRYTTDGGAVANWRVNDLQYSLYTAEASDRDVFSDMVKERILNRLDYIRQVREQAEAERYTSLEGHVQVVSGGETHSPFVTAAFGGGGNSHFDSPLVEPGEVKQAGALPSIPYREDFAVAFTNGGKLGHVIMYDGEYNRLEDRWNLDFFGNLESGTYFVNIIMREDRLGGKYTGYQCVFELVVP